MLFVSSTQPPKKQRLPLSVARVQMKKQKEREEKMLQEVIDFFEIANSFDCTSPFIIMMNVLIVLYYRI